MARIASIPTPDIALPTVRPTVPTAEYAQRLSDSIAAMHDENLDVLVVFGDRESSGDLHFLTGVDPRFEEAILLLDRDGKRQILLGNENQPFGPDASLNVEQKLYQELSPVGQFRNHPVQLTQLLGEFGVNTGTKVGIAGGKYLTTGFVKDPESSFTVPSYIVDTVRGLAGHANVRNAVEIFLHPGRGLRTIASVHQLAEYEYAAAVCSVSVHRAVRALKPGAVTWQVADQLFTYGLERSVHDMVNLNERMGLGSPVEQVVKLGDAYQIAQGVRGTLTCRSGAIAFDVDDLAEDIREFYPALFESYFDTMIAWYEALGIGVYTGDVFDAADAARNGDLFEFSLNPGHFLDFEEWSVSPFVKGDTTRLRPGTALQGDIIPVGKGPAVGVNIEDGLALADKGLREEIQNLYPEMWQRIEARRSYVTEHIGAELDESVLLFSNTPLWQAPYSLDTSRALTK